MWNGMDVKLNISVATVSAVMAAELLSVLFYNEHTPWGRWARRRYWVAALAADLGLALILQWVIRDYWLIRKWEDTAKLAAWSGVIYAVLEAPHSVYSQYTAKYLIYDTVHTASLVFVMIVCLDHFNDS